MITHIPDTQSSYDDSADDHSLNMMETPDNSTTASKLHIHNGHSKFWVMVDSRSSTSILTEQMAKDIETRDSNTWWSRTTNPVKLKSYTDTPIKNLGTLYCDIVQWLEGRKCGHNSCPKQTSSDHRKGPVQTTGNPTSTKRLTTSTGKSINSINTLQTPTIKEEVAIKYKNLTTRIGRSIHHKVKSQFKSNYTPFHQKGRRVPLRLEKQVEEELKNLQNSGHITRLEKCSNELFISPILITVKKDRSIKLAMASKTINKAIHKKQISNA